MEIVGYVVGAMIMTQLQSARPPGRHGSEAPMHPLTHRLRGLEAIGRPRCMNADDFRIGVFHGNEDIGREMVIVCVMSVPHISLTLPVMIVPSCGLLTFAGALSAYSFLTSR